MSNPQNNKTFKFKGLIIALVILGAAIATGFYYKPYVIIQYYLIMHSPFKEGDKVYAKDYFVKDAKDSFSVDFKQLIRPADDNDSKKKPYVISSGWEVKSEKFFKAKSTYIGTYAGHKIVHVKREHDYYPVLAYVVNVNKGLMYKDYNFHSLYEPPAGYVKTMDPLYIPFYEITNKEAATFKK